MADGIDKIDFIVIMTLLTLIISPSSLCCQFINILIYKSYNPEINDIMNVKRNFCRRKINRFDVKQPSKTTLEKKPKLVTNPIQIGKFIKVHI